LNQDVIPSCAVGSLCTLSNAHVKSFLTHLKASGYAACKLRDKCLIDMELKEGALKHARNGA
jgi:hypothetical protein